MFLMLGVQGSEVFIMDTEDNCCVESVPIDVFVQSKVLGIPCETRYEEILSKFTTLNGNRDFHPLRAGIMKLGVLNVLASLCEAYGQEFDSEPLVGSSMPLSSLVSVTYNANDRVSCLIEGNASSEGYYDSFVSALDQLQYSEDYDDYDYDEDGSEELFSGDVDEDYPDEDIVYDDFEDDFEDFNYDDDYEEESSADMLSVAKLYGLLSDAQVDLLKRYYKWYSKRVFNIENGSLHLDTINSVRYNEWKKKELSNIRGDEEWSYEGCIDTGEFPGAYCEMGHALRYVHYARGAESDRVVAFGSKCVSDFFEVDVTTMRAINKAQRDSTNDLVELYKIYSDRNLLSQAQSSFTVLNFVLDSLISKGKLKTAIAKFALEFRNLHLVYPKTLVKEFKKSLLNLDTLKDFSLQSDRRSKLIELCFGDEGLQVDNYLIGKFYDYKSWGQSKLVYPPKSFDYYSACFFEWFFGIEFDGIHRYNPELGLNVKDEGGKSKKAKNIYANRELGVTSSIFYVEDDIINGAKEGISSVCAVLDAVNIFESFSSNWKVPYLNAYNAKYKNLDAIKECKEVALKMKGYLSKRYYSNVFNNATLRDEWFKSYETFLSVSYCLPSFKTGFSEICKTVVLDEKPEVGSNYSELLNLNFNSLSLDSSLSKLQYYINRISESPLSSYMESKSRFGLDVFETVSKTRRVSTKQANVLNRLGKELAETMGMLDSGNYENAKIEGTLSEDVLQCVEKAIKILETGDKFNIVIKVVPTSAMIKLKDVLCSVQRHKTASERQMYYVNLAKDLVAEVEKQ